MTKEKWENLTFDEKLDELIGSDLWEIMEQDYLIERTDGDYLNEIINERVNDSYSYNGWRELMDTLNNVADRLDSVYTGWVYQDYEYDAWDEFHELDSGELDELIWRFEETDEYEDFFTDEEPDFDGLEELIA